VLAACIGGACWYYYGDFFAPRQTEFNLAAPVSYFGCDDSQYYSGYGVEVLDTVELDDYMASLALETSSVCFKVAEPAVLASLKVVWYSAVEAPKSIEIIGSYSEGDKVHSDVLWKQDSPITVQAMTGFSYSDFTFSSDKQYSEFRIRYVAGGEQNRLLIRAVAPFFRQHVEGDTSKLLGDALRISKTAPYGDGVSRTAATDTDELASELKQQQSLHCGNYSYLLAYEIGLRHDWSAIGALSKLKASHTVVELNYWGKTYTVDPTLGALYFCSYADMQSGGCDFSSAVYTETYNPIMWQYKGQNFYPGAEIEGTYSNLREYYEAYQKLNLN
jgi:hypothetical protein